MVKKNNKASIGMLVGIIVVVLYFIIYLNFFSTLSHNVVSKTDDLACRAYVAAKSFPGIKLGEFFYSLKYKCKVDTDVELNLEEQEESFEKIANNMARCWYRYGEGKYDFLSSFDTSGNWCFLCAEMIFEENSESLLYTDFVEWTQENDFNESTKYFNYISLKYTDVDDKEIKEIRKEFDILLKGEDGSSQEEDAAIKQMLYLLGEQITVLDDLRLKQIDASDEEMYVVYRYDRIDKSFQENIEDATKGMFIGLAGGFVATIMAETLVETAFIGTVTGGIGAIPGFFITAVKNTGKAVWNTGKSVDKVFSISKLMKRVLNWAKKSKSVRYVDDVFEVDNFLKVITIGNKKDILNLADKLEEGDEYVDSLKDIYYLMDKLKLDDLNDIDALKFDQLKKIDNVADLYHKNYDRMAKATKNSDILKRKNKIDQNLGSLGKSQINLEDIEKLNKKVGDVLEKIKTNPNGVIGEEDAANLLDYFRTIVVLGSVGTGAITGSVLNGNYEQYVDLLTREQYYRLCGTERGNYN